MKKQQEQQDAPRFMRHYVHNYILNPYHELTVNVIGCGGTGSQVLTALGRMNYALKKLGHLGLHVTAYDGDIVTAANCGRQLFSEQEIGCNKAEALITKAEGERKVVEARTTAEADVLKQEVAAYAGDADYVRAKLYEKAAPQLKDVLTGDAPGEMFGLPVRPAAKGGAK